MNEGTVDSINKKQQVIYITAFFMLARLILFVSSPFDFMTGYGDYWNFFQQAELGWPYIDYWTEFPPVFPIISRLLYLAVTGRESAYIYSLALIISLFQAGCVWMIGKLEIRLYPSRKLMIRTLFYAFLTTGLFYSWSYFDPLAVYFLLLALVWLLEGKENRASGILSLGVLVKWFPFVVLPAMWKIKSKKVAVRNTVIVVLLVAVVWSGLYLLNNEMTGASLVSQGNKGSWETIWALIDGNLGTGNFSSEVNRRISATALSKTGNDSKISIWVTLAILGGFGALLLQRANLDEENKFIAFVGVTLVIFFLWSPGYSPQWVLYLMPFALLLLPLNEGVLFSAVLLLINLLEWPVLLSRGYFWSLIYLIPTRTLLMILLGTRLYQCSIGSLSKTKIIGNDEI